MRFLKTSLILLATLTLLSGCAGLYADNNGGVVGVGGSIRI